VKPPKKVYFILILFLINILLSGCGLYNLNNFIIPDDLEFISLIQELNTPQKIGDYMLENFTYEFHDLYILDPYSLWKLKKGDCNDFVTFGTFIADYHGYTTYQLGIYYKNFKHRIAIYLENNYYSITNNQYYYSDFYTFREIVDFDSESRNIDWLKYEVYDYSNNLIEKN